VVPVAAGAQIKTTYVTNASPYWGFTGEPEFGGWGGTMLDVQYEGPPLAGGVGMAWPPAR